MTSCGLRQWSLERNSFNEVKCKICQKLYIIVKCFKNSKFSKHRNSFQVLYILFMMTQGRWKQSILSVTINLGVKNYEDETGVYPSMVSTNSNYCVKPIISKCQNVYGFIFPNFTQSKESNIKKKS